MKLRNFIQMNAAVVTAFATIVVSLFFSRSHFIMYLVIWVAALVLTFRLRATVVGALVGALIAGVHFFRFEWQVLPTVCFDQRMAFTGRISSVPKHYTDMKRSQSIVFDLEVTELSSGSCSNAKFLKASIYRALSSPDVEEVALQEGDIIIGDARLRPAGSRWSQNLFPENVRSLAKGVDAYATLYRVERTANKSTWSSQLRQQLSDRILKAVRSDSAARLLLGLLLGRQDALSQGDWSLLRRLGIVHVMVVSGLHVSVAALWCIGLFALRRRMFNRVRDSGDSGFDSLLICLAVSAYVTLTGTSLPAQRALLMLCIALLAKSLLWRTPPLTIILLSATLLAAYNPWDVLTSSFWLSVLLTGVILIETARLRGQGSAGWLRLQFTLTIASSVLTVVFFNQLSWAAFLSNLLIVPLFTLLILPLGLLGLLLAMTSLPWGGGLLSAVGDALHLGITCLLAFDSEIGPRSLQALYPHAGVVALLSLLGLALSLRKRAAIGILLTIIGSLKGASEAELNLEFTIADVGQGTLALLRAGRFVMVYDTGGSTFSGNAIAEDEFIPWLKSSGIEQLDLLVVSHGDQDHAAGIPAFGESFRVANHLGFGGVPCMPGKIVTPIPALEITLLAGSGQSKLQSNDDSCVVSVTFNGRTLLLMGDVSTRVEMEILTYWPLDSGVDVVLVSHHGSLTSSAQSFVDKIDAAHAVFTTRRGNQFGHPASEVWDRFLGNDSVLWDTAISGAITFTFPSGAGTKIRAARSEFSPYWSQLN